MRWNVIILLAAGCASAQISQSDNPVFREIRDEAGLPRVLLVGDSISIGYTEPVREILKGKVNVHRIPMNGGPTTRGALLMDQWLAKGSWDVIHFNFGLHDLKYMPEGAHQVPLPEYEANLEKIVSRLERTGARLIWATTTPVPEGKLDPPRTPADVILYNDAARRVMARHRAAVDDLYEFIMPELTELQRPLNVHFTDAGSRALAIEVTRSILKALNK